MAKRNPGLLEKIRKQLASGLAPHLLNALIAVSPGVTKDNRDDVKNVIEQVSDQIAPAIDEMASEIADDEDAEDAFAEQLLADTLATFAAGVHSGLFRMTDDSDTTDRRYWNGMSDEEIEKYNQYKKEIEEFENAFREKHGLDEDDNIPMLRDGSDEEIQKYKKIKAEVKARENAFRKKHGLEGHEFDGTMGLLTGMSNEGIERFKKAMKKVQMAELRKSQGLPPEEQTNSPEDAATDEAGDDATAEEVADDAAEDSGTPDVDNETEESPDKTVPQPAPEQKEGENADQVTKPAKSDILNGEEKPEPEAPVSPGTPEGTVAAPYNPLSEPTADQSQGDILPNDEVAPDTEGESEAATGDNAQNAPAEGDQAAANPTPNDRGARLNALAQQIAESDKAFDKKVRDQTGPYEKQKNKIKSERSAEDMHKHIAQLKLAAATAQLLGLIVIGLIINLVGVALVLTIIGFPFGSALIGFGVSMISSGFTGWSAAAAIYAETMIAIDLKIKKFDAQIDAVQKIIQEKQKALNDEYQPIRKKLVDEANKLSQEQANQQ